MQCGFFPNQKNSKGFFLFSRWFGWRWFFTELLEEKSLKVAEKTVYGWESSATQPDADTLLLLCDIYNIDNILGTFGYTDEEPINLTKHEHHLIEQYRKHPEIQDAVDKLLDIN